MSEFKKNDLLTVTIDGYAENAMGVARADGRVLFVQGALRGEECRVQLLKVGKNVSYAKAVEILSPSPARRESDCPYFPRCGGCCFRHTDYEEELWLKRRRVQDDLARIGKSDVTVEEILGAQDILRYRNKAIYPVAADGTVGFYRARTHEVIGCDTCLLVRPEAEAAANALREYLAKVPGIAYDEATGKGLVRYLFVRSNAKGECLIAVIANGDKLPHEETLVSLFRSHCPSAVGILLGVNKKRGNAVLGDARRTLWGQDTIEDTLCGLTFRLSVPSFYQVNHDQAEVLYEKAVEFAALSGAETVLDLYCGAGTITLCMAQKAGRVIGAEIVPEAIADARENARANGITNAEFFCGDAGAVAAKLAAENLHPDVVTVDPPRKGLSEETVAAIVRMQPPRVVYVSCDPATLARDVARFAEAGYTAVRAAACDLFPRADHVETIALLFRARL